MKTTIKSLIALCLFLILGFTTTSCTKENTPNIDLMEKPDTAAVLKLSGAFQTGPFGSGAKGTANIYLKDSIYTLVFDSTFLINNGPALHVYLSKEIQPINFIDLGDLKSVMSGQIYDVADNTNFMEYKYALVHCKAYDHLFSYAELK